MAEEAQQRGYLFDVSKIAMRRGRATIPVTKGQLAYELGHLKQKLRQRDPKRLELICKREPVKVNSTFNAVEEPIADWERTPKDPLLIIRVLSACPFGLRPNRKSGHLLAH